MYNSTPGAGVSATLKPSRRDKWYGSDPLSRALHGTPPIRPLWAEPGGQKGGSLPSQHSLLGRPNGSIQETVNPQRGEEMRGWHGCNTVGRFRATRGSVSVYHAKNTAWNGPKRLLEAGCNDDDGPRGWPGVAIRPARRVKGSGPFRPESDPTPTLAGNRAVSASSWRDRRRAPHCGGANPGVVGLALSADRSPKPLQNDVLGPHLGAK